MAGQADQEAGQHVIVIDDGFGDAPLASGHQGVEIREMLR